jgi:hypothetical protein
MESEKYNGKPGVHEQDFERMYQFTRKTYGCDEWGRKRKRATTTEVIALYEGGALGKV